MALQVNREFIKEDIIDENDKKIGEIKFNPKDARIMNKLAIILKDLQEALTKVNKIEFKDVPMGNVDNIEDFEAFSDLCNKYLEATELENNVTEKVIKELTEIFGSDTLNCFTGGTNDLQAIMPLIEFVIPYVKEYKEGKVKSYLNKASSDVME